MDPHATTEFLQSAAATAAGGRLIRLGLARRFPALLSYLIFVTLLNFAYAVLKQSSPAYFYTYVVLAPLENVFSILVVRELLTVMFENYPGIRTVGRWAMYAGIAASTTVSITLTKLFWHTGATGRLKWGLFYIEAVQRSIIFTLVAVICGILFVLSKYPLHLGRNTYVSSAFFSALFLSDAARLFIDSMAQGLYNHLVDWTESLFIASCLAGWALLLQKEKAPVARMAFSTPHEDYLLQQLDSLNRLMSRAARR